MKAELEIMKRKIREAIQAVEDVRTQGIILLQNGDMPTDELWEAFTELSPLLPVDDYIVRLDVEGFEYFFEKMHNYVNRGGVVYWEAYLETLDEVMDCPEEYPEAPKDLEKFKKELVLAIVKSGVSGYHFDW